MHNKTLNALQFTEITIRQSENAAILYKIQWSSTFSGSTVISTSTWSTEDSNLTIADEADTDDDASARLSASSPGVYRAVNKIVTDAGDTDERTIRLVVKDSNRTYDYGF